MAHDDALGMLIWACARPRDWTLRDPEMTTPSGVPLLLAPERDDPELGACPQRNNDLLYKGNDPFGIRCPLGAPLRPA